MASRFKQDLATATWVLEATVGDEEYEYIVSEEIPCTEMIESMIQNIVSRHGTIPIRTLNSKEIVELRKTVEGAIEDPHDMVIGNKNFEDLN